MFFYIRWIAVLHMFSFSLFMSSSGETFTAAVVEPVTSEHILPHVTKESALRVINKNLNHYEEFIQTASHQKASIIVFPEYGITGFGQNRKTAKVFGEEVPNPYITVIIPCNDLTNSTILRKLSCLAIQYDIVVVANIIAIESCLPDDTHCPSDGHYVYNTDVAFERDGQLVAHYHKVNVYADEKEIFDIGRGIENYGVFKTEFATIGLFICFDMLFQYPPFDLVYGVGVDTMVFSTAWMNELPLLNAVEYQEAWSIRYNTTLLASNQHLPLVKMTGSGVYDGEKGALTYHYDMVTYRSKLLIVNVPKRKNVNVIPSVRNVIISKLRNMDLDTLSKVSPVIRALLDNKSDLHLSDTNRDPIVRDGYEHKEIHHTQSSFQGVMNDDLYTFQPLEGATGQLSVCNGSICCHLNYTREEMKSYELYALGVFDGLHTHNGQYYLQTCSLVKCQVNEGTKCGGEIETAKSIFNNFSLRISGYNHSVHLFPEVVTNKINLAVIGKEWISKFPYDHIRSIGNGIKQPLVVASIYGRWYERDTVLS